MDRIGLARSSSEPGFSPQRSMSSIANASMIGGEKYVDRAGLRHFIGSSGADASRLMAPHPMSPVRQRGRQIEVDIHDLRRLRQESNFVLATGKSGTAVSESLQGLPDPGQEFYSVQTLKDLKRKHIRSHLSPLHKYQERSISSHAIGWQHETDHGKGMVRMSPYGLRESNGTKRYVDMQATKIGLCLRNR